MRLLPVRALLILLLTTLAVRADAPPVDTTLPNLGILKQRITAYHDSGQWEKERAAVCERARRYLDQRVPGCEKPAMVLDIDETALDNWQEIKQEDYAYIPPEWMKWEHRGTAPAIPSTLALYRYARSKGVTVFFITGRHPDEQGFTERNLHEAGYTDFAKCYFRPQGELTGPFKTAIRKQLVGSGWHILVNMGDQYSDLDNGYAEGEFKLPNPAYYIP
ncbi:MAG: HAD family acid phosphatase [Candidatus Xenobia bacterium]